MADEDSFLDDDVASGGDVEVGQKTGFVPALLLKVLKWAAVALAAIIFIVTVVVFTMRIINQGTRPATVPAVSEEYRATPKRLQYYDVFEDIRTRTADDAPYTVIARVALGFDPVNKQLYNEIVERSQKLQDLIRSYFTQKTANEVLPKNEDIVKQEIMIRVNSIMANGKVEDIIFLEYNVIPM
jgi:flagellar protein FliL